MPKAKTTKKQKVENYVLKHPEAGPAEIAKKVGVAPAYAGQIRREMEKKHDLPALKRGRKAKVTTPKAKAKVPTPKPHVPPKTTKKQHDMEELCGGDFIETLPAHYEKSLDRRTTRRTTPNLFRRMLTALGLQ